MVESDPEYARLHDHFISARLKCRGCHGCLSGVREIRHQERTCFFRQGKASSVDVH